MRDQETMRVGHCLRDDGAEALNNSTSFPGSFLWLGFESVTQSLKQIGKDYYRARGCVLSPDCLLIFASLARAHERVHVQNVRDFPQSKLDSEVNAPFLLNEHGGPRLFFLFFLMYLLRTVK